MATPGRVSLNKSIPNHGNHHSQINYEGFMKGCKESALGAMTTAGRTADKELTSKIDSYCSCSAVTIQSHYQGKDVDAILKYPAQQAEAKGLIEKQCMSLLK